MTRFQNIFKDKKAIIGMIHLPALPGTPDGKVRTFKELSSYALSELDRLQAGGVNAAIVENFWDIPYLPNKVPAITVATMAAIAGQVKARASIPIGINILYNDFRNELAVARAIDAAFIRAEVFVDTAFCETGIIEPSSSYLIRERSSIYADEVAIFADIHGKNTSPMWQRPLTDAAIDAQDRGKADAIIITGAGTGKSASITDIKNVREQIKIPILVGSGVNPKTVKDLFDFCDGAIIGSCFKEGGSINGKTDVERVKELISALKR